jgi:uncharacterized membrane protein (DUF2068 family)
VDWSTLSCGRNGHLTFAPDEPELRAQMSATSLQGQAWQCLRCGSFVTGEPSRSGPAAQAPVVPRGKEIRSNLILRLFAIERFVRGVVAAAVAYGLWHYRHSQYSMEQTLDRKLPLVRDLFRQIGINISNSKYVGLLQHAVTLSSRTLALVAAGLAFYAVIELVEGTGLWLARRWGEYFALIATSLGLPIEIYELSRKVTVTASVLFAVNIVLVLYLVLTKRLFGARGGKKAYDARLTSESVLEAAVRAAAAVKSARQASAASDGVASRTAHAAGGHVAPGAADAHVALGAADAHVAPGRITDK